MATTAGKDANPTSAGTGPSAERAIANHRSAKNLMKAWETATERLIDAGMLRQMIRSNSHIERLGPPPIINHFMARMGLDDVLARHVSSDARCAVPHARALCVLLRVEREPIHHQQKTVNGFAAGMFGIAAEEMQHLGDDRLGCALDRLFDADRAALLTDVMTARQECHSWREWVAHLRAQKAKRTRGAGSLGGHQDPLQAHWSGAKQLAPRLSPQGEGVSTQRYRRCHDWK